LETNDYLDFIQKKFDTHFIIDLDTYIIDRKIDMLAKCNLILGRTLISKNDIIDRYESNEYIVVKTYNAACKNDIVDFLEFTSKLPSTLVKPHKEHRNSYINAVMVCGTIDDLKNVEYFKNFKFTKIYKFYLHGFCEIRAVLVNLKNSSVVTNKAGNQLNKVYTPTP
jgi:hypothetical protein